MVTIIGAHICRQLQGQQGPSSTTIWIEGGYLRSWSKYHKNLLYIYITKRKSNWIHDVPVNIVEWYKYYSTHRNSEKQQNIFFNETIFFKEKKILAFWYFANQSDIVWEPFSKNKNKWFFGQNSPYPPL